MRGMLTFIPLDSPNSTIKSAIWRTVKALFPEVIQYSPATQSYSIIAATALATTS